MYNQYTYQTMSAINRHMKDLGDKVIDISNSFSTGYRGRRTTFHETINGVRMLERRNFNNGVPVKTERELDFAIEGKGFFEVELPDGTRAYTRDGSFSIGADGQLLSSQGYPVITGNPNAEMVSQNYDDALAGALPSYDAGAFSGGVIIPIGSTLSLNDKGILKTSEGDVLGKLSVVTFTNPDGLKDIGNNLFIATDKAGEIHELEVGSMLGESHIRQGYVEQSNVTIVDKMTDVVQLNTAIKSEMKMIKLLDQMQENLNSSISRNI